ncbi:MAG: isocitrate lyase/PEP mutase family protein [Rhodospirillales bacterium]|jgi:2-methylisocitrate lyase-like PEP mutase family enzyme|nr:isocitrate lyase/PEP mutase family protein [Rhodospirillales bacterium]
MADMKSTCSLKHRLSKDKTMMVPGAYDALSAHIAANCGAEAVYMTGFGVSGSMLGVPDLGLLSATEMADRARALASATAPVPLIADADNGHGGILNVGRMVRLYEQADVQCIQLEDQVSPKRCGHMASKEVVDRTEAVAKITAAVDTRTDPDFLIMARTDARAVIDLDEALWRGESFLEAGADILFIESPQTEIEMRKIAETFEGTLLVANMVEDGMTPYLTRSDLQELGFAIALYPISSLLVVTKTLQDTYASMLDQERLPDEAVRLPFNDYNTMMGLDKLVPTAVPK